VLFTSIWDNPSLSPQLSLEVTCDMGGSSIDCFVDSTPVPGRWDFAAPVKYSKPVNLSVQAELFVRANFTSQKPANLHQGGGVIPLHYELIDQIFTENVSEAIKLEDDRYPVSMQYPWDSTNFLVASIEELTTYDAANSLKWSNNDEFPKYNFYNVYEVPGATINESTTCFGTKVGPCTISVILQVTPESLVSEIRQSGPGIESVDILLDEGAIVGGLSFFAFFLTMYMV